MNTIKEYEDSGIKTLKQVADKYCKEEIIIKPTPQHYRFDAGIRYKDKKYIVEIKSRNMNHDKYKEWFLEVSKRLAMLKIVNANGYDGAYYFNYFTDDIALLWNIQDVEGYTIKELWMNSKTASDISTGRKQNKKVILLPTKHANKYEL